MKRIMSSVLALLLIVGVVVRLSPFYYVSAEASPIITINYGNTTEKSKIDECVKQINTDIKENVYLNVTGFAKNDKPKVIGIASTINISRDWLILLFTVS